MAEEVERSDSEAMLAARRELGPDYERELVDSFADRIERAVDERVADRLHRRDTPEEVASHVRAASGGVRTRQFTLGVISLAAGVPVTIVPTVVADNGLPATVVAWLGIVGVNVAHAFSVRGARRRPEDVRRDRR